MAQLIADQRDIDFVLYEQLTAEKLLRLETYKDLNKKMFDKKYIFLPETIVEQNFTQIPILDKRGVFIK